jgi:hypothetical protein
MIGVSRTVKDFGGFEGFILEDTFSLGCSF